VSKGGAISSKRRRR